MSCLSPQNSSEIPDPLNQLAKLAAAPVNANAGAVQAGTRGSSILDDDMQTEKASSAHFSRL